LPSTYPSSVPSTSPCAPKSSMATTVACHNPPQLRFDSSRSGLCRRCGDGCLCCASRLPLAAAETAAFCTRSCNPPNCRVVVARPPPPLIRRLAAAETTSRLRLLGMPCARANQ
jgi:hypothetical protein